MRLRIGRPALGGFLILLAAVALATSCSKPAQEAPQGATSGPAANSASPAATGQPAPAPPAPDPAAPPEPPAPRTFTLAEGTILTVRPSHKLSSDTVVSGDTFEASLSEPLVEGEWVVAKEGALVEGLVVAATKGGRVKGTAQLQVAITAITLADGQRIRIETAMATAAAKSEAKQDVGKVGVTTGAGALIGAIAGGGKGAAIGAAVGGAGGTAVVMGTRGKPAEIPARSPLRFRVTRPVEITEKK